MALNGQNSDQWKNTCNYDAQESYHAKKEVVKKKQ